jgi:hypothetical protein
VLSNGTVIIGRPLWQSIKRELSPGFGIWFFKKCEMASRPFTERFQAKSISRPFTEQWNVIGEFSHDMFLNHFAEGFAGSAFWFRLYIQTMGSRGDLEV